MPQDRIEQRKYIADDETHEDDLVALLHIYCCVHKSSHQSLSSLAAGRQFPPTWRRKKKGVDFRSCSSLLSVG